MPTIETMNCFCSKEHPFKFAFAKPNGDRVYKATCEICGFYEFSTLHIGKIAKLKRFFRKVWELISPKRESVN